MVIIRGLHPDSSKHTEQWRQAKFGGIIVHPGETHFLSSGDMVTTNETQKRKRHAVWSHSTGATHTIVKRRLAFTYKGDRRPTAVYATNYLSERFMRWADDEVIVQQIVNDVEAALAAEDDEELGEDDPNIPELLTIAGIEPNPGPGPEREERVGAQPRRPKPQGQNRGRTAKRAHEVKAAHVDEVSKLQGEIDALKALNNDKVEALKLEKERAEKIRLAEGEAEVDDAFTKMEALDSVRYSRDRQFVSKWDFVFIFSYIALLSKVTYDVGVRGIVSLITSLHCAFLRVCYVDHFDWNNYLRSAMMALVCVSIVLAMYVIFRRIIGQPFLSRQRKFISRVKFAGWVDGAERKIDMRTAGMSMSEMKKKCRVALFDMTVSRPLNIMDWEEPRTVRLSVSAELLTQCRSPHVTYWGLEPNIVMKKMDEIVRCYQDANFDRVRSALGHLDMQDARIVAYELYLADREKRSDLLFPRPSFI